MLDDAEERELWFKWLYWNKGIPAHQYRKERKGDVLDIMNVNQSINEKNMRQAQMNKLISQVK